MHRIGRRHHLVAFQFERHRHDHDRQLIAVALQRLVDVGVHLAAVRTGVVHQLDDDIFRVRRAEHRFVVDVDLDLAVEKRHSRESRQAPRQLRVRRSAARLHRRSRPSPTSSSSVAGSESVTRLTMCGCASGESSSVEAADVSDVFVMSISAARTGWLTSNVFGGNITWPQYQQAQERTGDRSGCQQRRSLRLSYAADRRGPGKPGIAASDACEVDAAVVRPDVFSADHSTSPAIITPHKMDSQAVVAKRAERKNLQQRKPQAAGRRQASQSSPAPCPASDSH